MAGFILYSCVGIFLHIEIGYVSLAVGYMVGKAMMKGSGNIGGRRYQWVAVLLTYCAVSMSAVPIVLAEHAREIKATKAPLEAERPTPPRSGAVQNPPMAQATPNFELHYAPGVTPPVEPDAASQAQPAAEKADSHPKMGFWKAIGLLALIGLASPLLAFAGGNPLSALIGIVILLVGVRIAWRIAAGAPMPTVEGPY